MSEKNIIDIKEIRRKQKKAKRTERKKKAKREALSPRKKKQLKRKLLTYLLIIVFLALTLGYSTYKIITLRVEKSNLNEEKTKLEQQRDELKAEKKDVKSSDYIEKEAREQLHLILPGEILYMLPSEDDSSEDGGDK